MNSLKEHTDISDILNYQICLLKISSIKKKTRDLDVYHLRVFLELLTNKSQRYDGVSLVLTIALVTKKLMLHEHFSRTYLTEI